MSERDDDDGVIDNIAQEILRYLAESPRSSDTLDGIALWWLQNNAYPRLAIQKALDLLVKDLKVVARKNSNGDTYYFKS
ncbi:hypothetical protein [Aurantivibrio plasticivorans]